MFHTASRACGFDYKRRNYRKYSEEQVLNFIGIINMGIEAKIRSGIGKEISEKDIDGWLTETLELLQILKKGLMN